jgi:hypothetical protein
MHSIRALHIMEEDRTPVGRPDFKSGEARVTCLVGSTPTLFRHFWGKFTPNCALPLMFSTICQHVFRSSRDYLRS